MHLVLFVFFFRWLYPAESNVIFVFDLPCLIVGVLNFLRLQVHLFSVQPCLFEGPSLHHRWRRWNELENSSLVFHITAFQPIQRVHSDVQCILHSDLLTGYILCVYLWLYVYYTHYDMYLHGRDTVNLGIESYIVYIFFYIFIRNAYMYIFTYMIWMYILYKIFIILNSYSVYVYMYRIMRYMYV